jgi:hypothetical protein
MFRKPPVFPKIVLKKPAMNVHWRKSNNEREGKPELKFDVAFGTVFELFRTMFRISKSF